MPGMYGPKEYDLAGFALGVAERSGILPRLDDIKIGDVVIGLASSGIHSNGFSLVRHVIEKNNINLNQTPPFACKHASLADALLEPTTIYVKALLPLIHGGRIKALAHITGGGLPENIPRILPRECGVELDMSAWEIPPVFTWLARVGHIDTQEMLRTFNMGIGMVALVSAAHVDDVRDHLEMAGQKTYGIGLVVALPENKNQVIIRNC